MPPKPRLGQARAATFRAAQALWDAEIQAEIRGGDQTTLVVDGKILSCVAVARGVRIKVPRSGTFLITSEPGAGDELRGLVWGARRFVRGRKTKRGVKKPVETSLQQTARFLSGAGIAVSMARRNKVAGLELAPVLLLEGRPIAGVRGDGAVVLVIAESRKKVRLRTIANSSDHLARALVHWHFMPQAVAAAKRNLPNDGSRLDVDESNRITLSRRDRVVCEIDVVDAKVPGEPVIRGNFLADGGHWQQLADARQRHARAVVESERRTARAQRREEHIEASPPLPAPTPVVEVPAVHVVREPPPGLPSAAVAEAIDASRKIRTERQTAYHFTSHLHLSASETIAFAPIESTPRLRVPFVHRVTRSELRGEIRLHAARDPLAVAIHGERPQEPLIARAWLLALLGFAALTCPEPMEPPRVSRSSAQALHGRHRSGPVSRPARSRHWSEQLRIRGERGQALPHLVVAHRRHLTGGRTASSHAIQAARAVGIVLTEGETWVRGHSRGLATVTDAHFEWRPTGHLQGLVSRGMAPHRQVRRS